MLWNILVCLGNLTEGLQFKPDNCNFDFIKILTQIINNFVCFFGKKKRNNLILYQNGKR